MTDCGMRPPQGTRDCGLGRHESWFGTRSAPLIVGVFFTLFALLCSGCGPDGEGIPVEGTITYNSQPLTHAAVTFFPQQGRAQTAPLDGQGAYSIRLPAGNYKVTVTVGAEVPEGYQEGDPLPPPKVVLPHRYTHRVRTELTATVTEDQSEPINFDLK